MSLINHFNVIMAHCSFVVARNLWVVMPFMDKGSCLHLMKIPYPDGFEESAIASFLKETLKALVYLHHHGHIHRDVKAGNILLDSHGKVKFVDFGVSACMLDQGDRQRSRNTFVGTPCCEDGKLSCGYSSFRGNRASMEDFYYVKISKIDGTTVCLCGIFDDKVEHGENIRVGSGSPTKRMVNNLVSDLSSNGFVSDLDVVRYSGNPDMWKTWSRERAGLKDMEFEAAEICFNECHCADFPLNLCYKIQILEVQLVSYLLLSFFTVLQIIPYHAMPG